jgi:hypothetical protein
LASDIEGGTWTEGVPNKVLRRIFGTRRVGTVGGRRKLHNKELHNLYLSQSISRTTKSRKMRWVWHVACMGETMFLQEDLKEKTRSRHGIEYSIEINLKEMELIGVDWFHVAQDREQCRAVVNAVLNRPDT